MRDGEFITECRPDGAFAVAGLGGTVLVRSPVSGTVVLRRHDAVLVDASGSAGPVMPLSELELPLRSELAVLAEEPAGSDGPADAVEPTTRAAVDPGSPAGRGRPRAVDRPWQAAAVAGAALVAGLASLLVGRTGGPTPAGTAPTRLPVALVGPPAVDSPAFQSPASGADERDDGVRRPGRSDRADQEPADATTAAGPAPSTPAPAVVPAAPPAGFDLTGLRCARSRPDAVGRLAATADMPALRVAPHASVPVTAAATGDALRQVVSCRVTSVDVKLGQPPSPLAN